MENEKYSNMEYDKNSPKNPINLEMTDEDRDWCYNKQVQVCTNRSCAALASFSDTFDLILFEAVYFKFIVEKAWFGLVWFG